MDNHNITARIKEFDRAHGGNSVFYRDWIWYLDGSNRDSDPHGVLRDPPRDDYERLGNVVTYHEGRRAIAVREFDNFKEELMGGFPDGEGLDRLKQLQAVVGERNAAVEEAKKQLAASPEGQRREQRRQQTAENRQNASEFKHQVRAIKV